jgi:NADH dehydrogenase FAD-containing subunit
VSLADSILIAGGGVVGVELAGELAVKYGANREKKLGICLKGDRLVPNFPPKAARLAERFLRRNNMEIYY